MSRNLESLDRKLAKARARVDWHVKALAASNRERAAYRHALEDVVNDCLAGLLDPTQAAAALKSIHVFVAVILAAHRKPADNPQEAES